ncbi:hypothetical protein [Luteolibacter luteus]|uniref:Uncharacterized protein n=1 Tax=Luteolibacter luteus TaxID=2728835 RepID=A0A858RF27_9BACT|nr:hypothetical protein [Luteolibacter luteus]QJE95148.1 hypothetical protein HHL09_04960 [Luteolibacter luteus]
MATRKLGLKYGEKVEELKGLHPLKRTKAVNVTGETPPQIVALDKKDPQGKPLSVDIKLPADLKSPLVLIIPDPKHPTGVRPYVIEDNTANFKWGSIRVLNATGKVALIKVDTKVAELPSVWSPIDIDPGGTTRNVSVQAAMKDKPANVLYSAVWEHNVDVRELVIVVPSTTGGPGEIDFKVIPENRKIIEAEAAAEAKER